ncbi:hypothetical protein NDU88_005149 [Pleurodeles waltl]|uniref:Uncharacterized protein n=1 Tax=Pleurodeles waltl TaxID=8319 RepID=A0AAV7PEP4_PLEWA|nr:hypothetical protein NDU88_005149 [Pleurodeles waltl]
MAAKECWIRSASKTGEGDVKKLPRSVDCYPRPHSHPATGSDTAVGSSSSGSTSTLPLSKHLPANDKDSATPYLTALQQKKRPTTVAYCGLEAGDSRRFLPERSAS